MTDEEDFNEVVKALKGYIESGEKRGYPSYWHADEKFNVQWKSLQPKPGPMN